MDVKKNLNKLVVFPLFLSLAIIMMSVGYAAINSISLNVSGTVTAEAPDGIFISNVVVSSSENVESSLSSVDTYFDTTFATTTVLSDTDGTSSVTYTVTIYNNGNDTYYVGTTYDDSFYSNSNIIYTVSLEEGTLVSSGSSVDLTITFTYDDQDNIDDYTLTSYIKFEFKTIYNITYNNISSSVVSANSYPTTVIEGEDISITLSSSTSVSSVTMGGETLTLDTDYTFEDSTLVITNVTGDVVITIESVGTAVENEDGSYYSGDDAIADGTVLEDGWEGNVYTLTFGVDSGIGSYTTYTYTVEIINSSDYTWMDVTSTDTITDGGSGLFGSPLSSFESSVSSDTIEPGETLTITFTVVYRTSLSCSASAQTVVTFTSNGEEVELILNISMEMQ